MYLFLDNYFETINVLAWSHIASHSPVDDSLDDDCYAEIWTIKANEPHVLDYLTVVLSTLEVVEEQKYEQFCQLIRASERSRLKLGFCKDKNELLRCQHASIP